jgi:hypothetical protein
MPYGNLSLFLLRPANHPEDTKAAHIEKNRAPCGARFKDLPAWGAGNVPEGNLLLSRNTWEVAPAKTAWPNYAWSRRMQQHHACMSAMPKYQVVQWVAAPP